MRVVVNAVQQAADRLEQAQRTHTACRPVRDLLGVEDVDTAYAVQSELTRRRTAQGARIAGRKIGLTSAAVQRQLGVFQPDFGTLFGDMSFASGAPIEVGTLLQPRVEAEIAYVLSKDLDLPDTSVAHVIRATDFVLAALEVVASRVEGWDIRITDTIADNASSGAFVLGATPYSLTGLDLAAVGVVLDQDGEPVAFGAGSACLGSPTVAVAWLARELARRGDPLRAGDVVLSGALCPMVPVAGPGRFRARLDRLSEVEAVFT